MISIYDCKDGDIIASDVINDYGVLIVVQNTEMNSYIREKLINQGIHNVRVITSDLRTKDPNQRIFINDYRKNMNEMKNILDNLAVGHDLDLKKVSVVTDLITNKSNQISNIAHCLNELKSKDEYTYTHSINTAFYSMLIGKWIGLNDEDISKVTQAGLLHDIGKTRIPKEILNKKGILSDEEYDIIKKHTILGYNLLKETIGLDDSIMRAVLLHHERADQSGYPFRMEGDHIEIFPRIIAVADVYDAMTSDRIYKKGITPFEAFGVFQSACLSEFDITIVNIFIKNLSAYYVGMNVELSNGLQGEIIYVPPHDLSNPIISTENQIMDLAHTNLRIIKMV